MIWRNPDIITDAPQSIATRRTGESQWIRAKSATHSGSLSPHEVLFRDVLDAVHLLICPSQLFSAVRTRSYSISQWNSFLILTIDQATPAELRRIVASRRNPT